MRRLLILILLLLGSVIFHDALRAAEVKLALKDAIAMALNHSYSIKGAQFDSMAAIFDYEAARAQQYPTLGLNAVSFYKSKLQKLELPFASEELGSKENYQADFKLSQLLFAGGRVSNQIKMLQANAELKNHGLEAEKLGAAYLARRAYLNLMMTISVFESARASLTRVEIIKKDVMNLQKAGMADSVDILDAETAYQTGVGMQAEKETARANASILLSQIIGASSEQEIVPVENLSEPDSSGIQARESTGPKLNRPELKGLDSRINSANFMVGLNKAAYFPNLSGYVGYSVGMPNQDQFNRTWNDYFNVGLALSWEFNFGGKVRNLALSAKNAVFSARMAKSKLEESLLMERDVTLQNLKFSYQAYAIAKREFEISTDKFRLAKERQRMGQMSVNRLLELEAELTTTEQMYHTSIINYYLSETEYLYVTGAERIYGGL